MGPSLANRAGGGIKKADRGVLFLSRAEQKTVKLVYDFHVVVGRETGFFTIAKKKHP
jgi:hypothetical protein